MPETTTYVLVRLRRDEMGLEREKPALRRVEFLKVTETYSRTAPTGRRGIHKTRRITGSLRFPRDHTNAQVRNAVAERLRVDPVAVAVLEVTYA